MGKTEAAKAMAAALDAPLIRLQCYEGLDIAHAVYEWNYARQLLHIRAAQAGTVDESELFGPEFLIRRPVLEAIESESASLLLIDEIDRADEEFEAFLLEVLSDFQVTVPGARDDPGAHAAVRDPHVESHPRAARRAQAAVPLPLDRPPVGRARDRDRRAARAGSARPPGRARRRDSRRSCASLDLQKPPGLAETIDWVRALTALGRRELDVEHVQATLGSLLKYHEDHARDPRRGARGPRRAARDWLTRTRSSGTSSCSAACCARAASRSGRGRDRRRAARPRRGRPRPPGGRVLDASADARRTARGPRDVRPRLSTRGSCARPARSRPRPLRPRRCATANGARAACPAPGRRSTAARSRSARGAATSCCARATSRR